MFDGSCCDSKAGYGHTVVTTNNGTFACNPWSEDSGNKHFGFGHSAGVSMGHDLQAAWPRLQVLTSYDSTSNSPETSLHGPPPLGDSKPRLSRLEKKRMAAKRQRERKKCEITEASQKLARLEATFLELQSQNEALKLKSTVMETLVKTSDEHLRIVTLVSKVAGPNCAARHARHAKSGSQVSATPGLEFDLKDISCAHLNSEDFRRVWKKVISKGVGLCSSGACQEVIDQFALDVMTWLENWSVVTDSATYFYVVSTEMENGTNAEPPYDHWHQVAKTLNLSSEQRKRALVGLEVVEELLNGVVSEQRSACAHLDELMRAACDLRSERESLGISGNDTLDKLRAALCRERFVSDLADAFVWKHVLNSQQQLAAALNSYPFFPHAIGILNGIRQLSDKDTVSINTAGASLSDSWSS